VLEEDWLYLDDIVATQTPQRKRAIATAVALIQTLEREKITAFDERKVAGVFLRLETYETFLHFPQSDIWEEQVVDLKRGLSSAVNDTEACDAQRHQPSSPSEEEEEEVVVDVDYRIFCSASPLGNDHIWGSYTNGAGLYKREDLIKVGRMYGEPGDAFHDRYVEGNFAFRVSMKNCHAAIRFTNDKTCTRVDDMNCVGAFHHIGGGRGTRPMTAKNTTCADMTWNFFGTPLYEKYHKMAASVGEAITRCSAEELKELRDRQFRDLGTVMCTSM
jgi:hypothetical protein